VSACHCCGQRYCVTVSVRPFSSSSSFSFWLSVVLDLLAWPFGPPSRGYNTTAMQRRGRYESKGTRIICHFGVYFFPPPPSPRSSSSSSSSPPSARVRGHCRFLPSLPRPVHNAERLVSSFALHSPQLSSFFSQNRAKLGRVGIYIASGATSFSLEVGALGAAPRLMQSFMQAVERHR